MLANCSACGELYDFASEGSAGDPDRLCGRCLRIIRLRDEIAHANACNERLSEQLAACRALLREAVEANDAVQKLYYGHRGTELPDDWFERAKEQCDGK